MATGKMQNWISAISGKGVSKDESQKAYTEWATTFEKVNMDSGYTSHKRICETIVKVIPEALRSSIRVLDVGAGTGLVAKEIKKYGFSRIDAFEPSEPMLNEARNLNLYENYIVDFFTEAESDIPADTYDVITGSGIFAAEAHVSCESLYEMIRLVKPGGFIILTARHHLVNENEKYKHLEPLMRDLTAKGKWKPVVREVFPGYLRGLDGLIWCFQVL